MNQTPEQLAHDEIDRQLLACGRVSRYKKTFNLSLNIGVAIKELPTVYNQKMPMKFFVIDASHQRIYNLLKQLLDYFDAFQIGLTATDKRTFGSFDRNIVSDYDSLKQAEALR